jgi:hypothetical protein
VGVSLRGFIRLVAAVLLAGCAPLGEQLIGPMSASPDISAPSTRPTAEPSPSRIVVESPKPSAESVEDKAAAMITHLAGSRYQVIGNGTLAPIDASIHAEAIAALPERTGWIEEPWIWAGSTKLLAAARDGTLVGEEDRQAWIVFTDSASEHRAEGYWAFRTDAGDIVWYLKDSIAVTPCPSGANPP